MPWIRLGKAEQLLQMLGKAMTSAAVWRISPHDGVPVIVISVVACERAKYHPVIIYCKRSRLKATTSTLTASGALSILRG